MRTRLPVYTALAGGVVALTWLCRHAQGAEAPPTVEQVDLTRYLGRWYEIARYPNGFERDQDWVTATYTALPNGKIEVLNRGHTPHGWKQIRGSAQAVRGSGNARLKVTFFWPFKGDYWIIALDEQGYRWAVVGEPRRKYLWILSRESEIEDALYQHLLKKVAQLGYDPSRLRRTEQKPAE